MSLRQLFKIYSYLLLGTWLTAKVVTEPLVLKEGGTQEKPAIFDGKGMVIDLGIDVSGHSWQKDGDVWTSCSGLLAEYGLEKVMAGQKAGLFVGQVPVTIPRNLEA